mmetsp:Transcript_13554/g.11563  ORF Transcript_13554/g.11563 Transcript_13554/m.11563 type:complete len:158 (+) Transcript_13554:37-510(+)
METAVPLGSRGYTFRLRGRLFYKRVPKFVPRRGWNTRSKWLEGNPFKKGICVKVTVKSPRKPHSGLRKVARVRLSNKRVVLAFIPGIGHNLQVHSVVLVRGGRANDIPGCNYKVVRGKFDCLPVKDRRSRRSKYGVKKHPVRTWRMRMRQLYTPYLF